MALDALKVVVFYLYGVNLTLTCNTLGKLVCGSTDSHACVVQKIIYQNHSEGIVQPAYEALQLQANHLVVEDDNDTLSGADLLPHMIA